MKEKDLETIKLSNGKISFSSLIKRLGIDEDTLKRLLLELKLDGLVLETSNKYSLFPDNMMIGNVSVTECRNKVIFYDGKMIPLASTFFDYVILNDIVSFIINDKGEAEITSIIDRKIKNITCKVITNGKKKKIECFFKGLEISLPKDVIEKIKIQDRLLLK